MGPCRRYPGLDARLQQSVRQSLGCGGGGHAPGLLLDTDSLEMCWKNFRRAHVLAVDAIHAMDSASLVGLASTGVVYYPVTDRQEDVEAARQLHLLHRQRAPLCC